MAFSYFNTFHILRTTAVPPMFYISSLTLKIFWAQFHCISATFDKQPVQMINSSDKNTQ